MLASREFIHTLGDKLEDTMPFVMGSVRFAHGGKPIANTRPMTNSMRRASISASMHALHAELHARR